jgi:hypothetical protein
MLASMILWTTIRGLSMGYYTWFVVTCNDLSLGKHIKAVNKALERHNLADKAPMGSVYDQTEKGQPVHCP